MNDFWEEKNKPVSETKVNRRKINIDAIHAFRKNRPAILPQASRPQRKLPWKILVSIFIIIALISSIISSGLWAVRAEQDKIDFLKLIKDGKYLVLFQNNAEMRPSGGFIGSFAVVEFQNFRLSKITFNTNIYKLDQNYTSLHTVTPPAPLAEISNNKWSLRDANFNVSFPEAAEQIEWFYNQETGDNVSGVIALNASVVRDLLRLTGPISLPQYETQISADNFFTELTTQVEKNYYQYSVNRDLNEPKSILKDLFPELVKRLTNQNKIALVKAIYQQILQKEILFYANDQKLEKSILAANWGGEVQASASDYLSINNANIGGAKSSLNVSESLDYKVSQNKDALQADLTIIRSHSGSGAWPDGVNINYARVLVPEGSVLQSITLNGKDILKQTTVGSEAGKSYFAYFTQTKPGTSDVIKLTYTLPISSKNYSLLLQKQPGNLGDKVTVTTDDQLLFDGVLNTDKLLLSDS